MDGNASGPQQFRQNPERSARLPAAVGENQRRCSTGSVVTMALSERKIIARRAAFELQLNAVVNLGIGVLQGVTAAPLMS